MVDEFVAFLMGITVVILFWMFYQAPCVVVKEYEQQW